MKQSEHSRAMKRLVWLANCDSSSELDEFRAKYPNYTWPKRLELDTRDRLRRLWRRQSVDHVATEILFSEPFEYALDVEKQLRDGKLHVLPVGGKTWIPGPPAIVKHGEITHDSQNQFQSDVAMLLSRLPLAKLCARSRCEAPYFIAKKLITVYCTTDCVELVRKETQKDYWKRLGSLRRKKRAKQKQRREKRRG